MSVQGQAASIPVRAAEPKLRSIPSGRGGPSIESLAELVEFREVFAAFVVRRVKTRYKQAVLGLAWIVIQPLAGALVFAFFLGRLARLPSDGAPYFLFVLTGLTLWNFFAAALAAGIESLIGEAGVMRKVFFPREIPPLSVVTAAIIDLVVAVGVLLTIVGFTGRTPTLLWLLLPLPMAVVVVTVAPIALLLSGLNVYYRDVSYGLPFLLQLGLFLSPVLYSTSLVPPTARTLYEVLNPIAASIQAFRDILLSQSVPDLGILGLALLWSLVLCFLCYSAFKMIERRFADTV